MSILVYELVGRDDGLRFSPHCWKAVWSVAHKGLDWHTVPTRFLDVPSVEGGGRTVPVIRDGDRVVRDSFDIAVHLDEAYPDRPSLFGGEGGRAAARFVESWSQLVVHGFLGGALLMDIHDCLAPSDRQYFRESREARFGRRLEDPPVGREQRLDAFRASLAPLRRTLEVQPFLGGEAPLFPDYIVAGAFQWARVVSPLQLLAEDDPVAGWFGRVLDLHGGVGRKAARAA